MAFVVGFPRGAVTSIGIETHLPLPGKIDPIRRGTRRARGYQDWQCASENCLSDAFLCVFHVEGILTGD
jgi:hypothetical protein